MLSVITKSEYFEAMNEAIIWERLKDSPQDLKRVQDAFIYRSLKDSMQLNIIEIGGGDSRILRHLSLSNECWNLDEFLGRDGGPASIKEITGVKTIPGRLGHFSNNLPNRYFDILFSISVIEHLITADEIQKFFADGARILKQGGMMYHAIDLYVMDEPFDYSANRINLYLSLAQQNGLSFIEPPTVTSDLRFNCNFATNPDLSMFHWNRAAPSLSQLRLNAQSISLKMILRKTNYD
jgi:hypothetical protein